MSAQALNAEDDSFKHTIADELEGLFYVLMYASLLWLKHNKTTKFGEWMFRFFEDVTEINGRDSGGTTKQVYITNPANFTKLFKFDEPIQSWFAAMYKALETTAPISREFNVPLAWTRQLFGEELGKVNDGLKDVRGSDRVEHDMGGYHVTAPEVFCSTHISVVDPGFQPVPTGGLADSAQSSGKRYPEEFGAEAEVGGTMRDERAPKRRRAG